MADMRIKKKRVESLILMQLLICSYIFMELILNKASQTAAWARKPQTFSLIYLACLVLRIKIEFDSRDRLRNVSAFLVYQIYREATSQETREQTAPGSRFNSCC